MQKKKQKQGISLIVLVITIIIMIILAATIIISLNNNGIIDKANEAVDKTNEKQIQELASVAWANAYMNGARTKEEFKESVETALKNNNLNKEDYYISVTNTGVTIKNIDNVWIQKDNRTVVKGNTVLKIGDYIDDESGTDYKDGWQVLGAEDGKLLIISEKNVESSYTLGSNSDPLVAIDAYQKGINYLNTICLKYKNGAYATDARSVTVEDVNKITGYGNIKYNEGEINEYGNIVTYSYNGTNKPAFSGTNTKSGEIGQEHANGFSWFDLDNNYHNVTVEQLEKSENEGKIITTLTSTYYFYTANEYLDLEDKAYEMLFGSTNNQYYWLASQVVNTYNFYVYFGIRYIYNGNIYVGELMRSTGETQGKTCGVRAVIYLSSEFDIKENE